MGLEPREVADKPVKLDPKTPVHTEELPVVARLVVEIRSDGSRTIARGALEDTELGERVAVQAEGRTPLDLALSLGRALLQAPSFARQAARALLTSRKQK